MPSGVRDRSEDAENSIRVHQWLRHLPRAAATDARLWTYLSHAEYFEYCRARWDVPSDIEAARRAIVSHWFVGGGRGGLRRNAVARLWWAAALTFAPWDMDSELDHWRKPDPYHFTRVLLSNQDVYQGVVERRFGSSLRVRILLLQAIDEIGATALPSGASRFVTAFLKGVNLLSAHTEIEGLPCDVAYARLRSLALACLGAKGESGEVG